MKIAIEAAYTRGRPHVWIESDSLLTTFHVKNNRFQPPWSILHRWHNCLGLIVFHKSSVFS